MIDEDFVSFETAKLLKEKGFKQWCYKSYGDAAYHKGVPLSFDEECDLKAEGLEDEIEYVEGGYLYDFGCNNSKKDTKVWAAPALWEAMKWLREIHKLDIDVSIEYKNSKKVYYYSVLKKTVIRDIDCLHSETNFDSYEQACEAAIKYCLENLI